MSDPSTTHYGFVKPTVGADSDAWGGILNTDLDGVDTALFNVATSLSNVSSSMSGVSSSLSSAVAVNASQSTSLSQISSSLSSANSSIAVNTAALANTNTSLANVSTSLAGVNTSLGNVSSSLSSAVSVNTGQTTSLSQISSSLSTANTSLANVSTSLSNVSTSLANVSTSLAALPQAGTNANSAGYLGLPQNAISANYSLVLSDAGKHVLHNSVSNHTVTIPANASVAFPIGTVIKVGTSGGVVTLAITSDTMQWLPSMDTSSRTIGASSSGYAILEKVAATTWWVTGVGLT